MGAIYKVKSLEKFRQYKINLFTAIKLLIFYLFLAWVSDGTYCDSMLRSFSLSRTFWAGIDTPPNFRVGGGGVTELSADSSNK